MTDVDRDFDEELWRIASALASSVQDASDEEIREDDLLEGKDSDIEARKTRDVLLGAVASFRREKARSAYQESSKGLEHQHHSIPSTEQGRLELLTAVVAQQPQLQSSLTVHFRELDTLTDKDVTSQLNQLAALGVLAELEKPSPEDAE